MNELPYTVLATGVGYVEGPALGPNGWLLNVCGLDSAADYSTLRAGAILATHPDAPLETRVVFSTSTPETAGLPVALAFGPDAALYVTETGRQCILRVEPGGAQEEYATEWQGQRFRGPNDLCFDPDGNLYLSDPWDSSSENPIGGVYAVPAGGGTVERVDSGMEFPNGVAVRDGYLYVAESLKNLVWRYRLDGGGATSQKELFCRLPDIPDSMPDGLAFDEAGRLYVAHYNGRAVCVYSPDAELEQQIAVPGGTPTNLCFAGGDLRHLAVTVEDTGVLALFELDATGARLPFCPSGTTGHPWESVLPAR
jgi:gluconolactonase